MSFSAILLLKISDICNMEFLHSVSTLRLQHTKTKVHQIPDKSEKVNYFVSKHLTKCSKSSLKFSVSGKQIFS